jgi:threonine aldolase
MDPVRELADEWGLPVHLDGARIFNAATALGIDAREIAARADSVMCCLSKGLCAPVGSLLVGSKRFIQEARMKRKIMGGGMRQAGILGAAGIIALKEQVKRLAQDHARAKKLAEELATIPGIHIHPDETEINMVFFTFPPAEDPTISARILEIFAKQGISINPPEKGIFRFVTHYWIEDTEIAAILRAAREAFKA